MKRRRFFRAVRVKLECGCNYDINTSRWRVTKDLAACIVGDALRKGCWCHKHGGTCQPVKFLGVVRDGEA